MAISDPLFGTFRNYESKKPFLERPMVQWHKIAEMIESNNSDSGLVFFGWQFLQKNKPNIRVLKSVPILNQI